MIKQRYLDVLHILVDGLRPTAVVWALTGSCSFALQGVPVSPNDIDIQTDKAGAYEIARLFAPFVTEPVVFLESDKIRSHLGKMMIHGLQVEIMGDVQKRVDGQWEDAVDITKFLDVVIVNDMQIPVLSLDYEYDAYQKLGRMVRANLLKTWLEAQS